MADIDKHGSAIQAKAQVSSQSKVAAMPTACSSGRATPNLQDLGTDGEIRWGRPHCRARRILPVRVPAVRVAHAKRARARLAHALIYIFADEASAAAAASARGCDGELVSEIAARENCIKVAVYRPHLLLSRLRTARCREVDHHKARIITNLCQVGGDLGRPQ